MKTSRIRDAFERKLIADYEKYVVEWLKMTPEALIDCADVISATQNVRFNAAEYGDDKDLLYFLRFKNPLVVMRDLVLETMTAYPLSEDEIRDMVGVMKERGAEFNYEMDESYLPAESGKELSPDRAAFLLNRAMCYIGKYDREQDLYDTLHEIIGMSDAEIEEMGFDYLARYFRDEPDGSSMQLM